MVVIYWIYVLMIGMCAGCLIGLFLGRAIYREKIKTVEKISGGIIDLLMDCIMPPFILFYEVIAILILPIKNLIDVKKRKDK